MAENKTVVKSLVGDRITVDVNGMVRVGGVCIGRVIEQDGVKCLEIMDRMKARNETRGSKFVYATLSSLVDALTGLSNQGDKK